MTPSYIRPLPPSKFPDVTISIKKYSVLINSGKLPQLYEFVVLNDILILQSSHFWPLFIMCDPINQLTSGRLSPRLLV